MYPPTIVKVSCPCGNRLRIRTKQAVETKLCWNCGRKIGVKMSQQGSIIAYFYPGEGMEPQKRQFELEYQEGSRS